MEIKNKMKLKLSSLNKFFLIVLSKLVSRTKLDRRIALIKVGALFNCFIKLVRGILIAIESFVVFAVTDLFVFSRIEISPKLHPY